MKWIAAAASALLVAIMIFSNITGAVPKTSDTIKIEPEQIQEEIEETSEEVNEAADRMVDGLSGEDEAGRYVFGPVKKWFGSS